MDILALPIGCKTQSQSMTIPASYYSEDHVDFVDVNEFSKYNVTIHDKLIGPKVSLAMTKLPFHVQKLVHKDISL